MLTSVYCCFPKTVLPHSALLSFVTFQDNGSGTDFLKNAITYGQTEGLDNEMWRVDDVSVVFLTVHLVMVVGDSLCELQIKLL